MPSVLEEIRSVPLTDQEKINRVMELVEHSWNHDHEKTGKSVNLILTDILKRRPTIQEIASGMKLKLEGL